MGTVSVKVTQIDPCTHKEAAHEHQAGRHTLAHTAQLCSRGNRRRTFPFTEGATRSCGRTPRHTPCHRPDRQSSHKRFSPISASCLNPFESQQLPRLINPPRGHPTPSGVRVLPTAPPNVRRSSSVPPVARRTPSPPLPLARCPSVPALPWRVWCEE